MSVSLYKSRELCSASETVFDNCLEKCEGFLIFCKFACESERDAMTLFFLQDRATAAERAARGGHGQS